MNANYNQYCKPAFLWKKSLEITQTPYYLLLVILEQGAGRKPHDHEMEFVLETLNSPGLIIVSLHHYTKDTKRSTVGSSPLVGSFNRNVWGNHEGLELVFSASELPKINYPYIRAGLQLHLREWSHKQYETLNVKLRPGIPAEFWN